MRVADLRALGREHGLRSYSRLRKAELIAFLQDNLSRDMVGDLQGAVRNLLQGVVQNPDQLQDVARDMAQDQFRDLLHMATLRPYVCSKTKTRTWTKAQT